MNNDNIININTALARIDPTDDTPKMRRVYSAKRRVVPKSTRLPETTFDLAVEALRQAFENSSVDFEDPYILTLSVQEDW